MNIKSRLVLSFLLTIFLTTFSIVGLVVWQMRGDAEREFAESSLAQLERVSNLLEATMRQNEEIAASTAKAPELAAAFGKLPIYVNTKESTNYSRNELTPEGQALDKEFQRVQESHSAFAAVSVGMDDGAYWQYPRAPRRAGYDPRARSWYKQGMAASNTAITPAFPSSGTGEVIYSVLGKVRADGKTLGLITLDISLGTLVKQISSIHLGKTGYVMLLESNGTILADPAHPALAFKNISEGGIPGLKDSIGGKAGHLSAVMDGKKCFITFLEGYQGWKLLAIKQADEVYSASNTMILRIMGISGGIALVLLLMAARFANSISYPIREIAQTAQRIAEGDLRALPETCSYKGEMFILHKSLHNMVTRLLDYIKQVDKGHEVEEQTRRTQAALEQAESAREAAEKSRVQMLEAASQLESVVEIISTGSGQLAVQIREAERGAHDQASRVSEAELVVDRMNRAVQEVAKNAENASEASNGTRSKATNGAGIVEKAVRSIQNVQEEALKLKQEMSRLDVHAQSIDKIMAVISDIADQTNLLALNAAIEAARAGDAGRGFAVVADEVRKLAEKTMASTSDVAAAIQAIQQSAGSSMAQVDTAVAAIGEATGLTTKSGEALTEIVGMVDGTVSQVESIAKAGNGQAEVSRSIQEAFRLMRGIAENTVRNMREASGTVSALAEQANTLAGLISNMTRR